jgi:hypothetical protein
VRNPVATSGAGASGAGSSGSGMPARCPSCSGRLHVEKLACDQCGTEVQGHFVPCPVCALDGDTRRLFDLFLETRGNLKDVQRALRVSYPTARQRIVELFQKLDLEEKAAAPKPLEVLRHVREGTLTVEQAEAILRGSK